MHFERSPRSPLLTRFHDEGGCQKVTAVEVQLNLCPNRQVHTVKFEMSRFISRSRPFLKLQTSLRRLENNNRHEDPTCNWYGVALGLPALSRIQEC